MYMYNNNNNTLYYTTHPAEKMCHPGKAIVDEHKILNLPDLVPISLIAAPAVNSIPAVHTTSTYNPTIDSDSLSVIPIAYNTASLQPKVNGHNSAVVEPPHITHLPTSDSGDIPVVHTTYVPRYNALSQTLRAYLVTKSGLKKRVRIMIDDGSMLSIISRDLLHEMCLRNENRKVDLAMFVSGGTSNYFKNQYVCDFKIQSLCNTYTTPYSVEAVSCPVVSMNIVQIEVNPARLDYLSHINDFTDKLPMSSAYYSRNSKISLLLGEPYASRIKLNTIVSPALELPNCIRTVFGSMLAGAAVSNKETRMPQCYKVVEVRMIVPDFERFFSLESLGIPDIYVQDLLTYDEHLANRIMREKTTYSRTTKSFTTSIPWKEGPPSNTNRKAAYAAACRILRKTAKNPTKWSYLQAAFQKMYDKNFMELVPECDLKKSGQFFYLTYMPVFKDSLTTPVRICFCANQKTENNGASLNDLQLKGEDLLPNLAQLLLRFRKSSSVCLTDVSSMFSRFGLDAETRDYTRFYHSFEKPDKEGNVKMLSFRSTGVCFGLRSAPYICQFLLRLHTKSYEKTQLNLTAQQIAENTYMDDTILIAETAEILSTHVQQAKKIFDEASLPTHKYASNKPSALKSLPDSLICQKEVTTVLGSKWNKLTDRLFINYFAPPTYSQSAAAEEAESMCKVDINANVVTECTTTTKSCTADVANTNDEELLLYLQSPHTIDGTTYTKRTALSLIAKLFDVLGLISPYTLRAKLIMQSCWTTPGLDWDSVLPTLLQQEFKAWAKELHLLSTFSIERCMTPRNGQITEICTTADASGRAMAACVYVISVDADGYHHSRLAFAKAKVKPLKNKAKLDPEATVCRLELTAAELAVKVANFVRDALHLSTPPKMRYFSDSQVTLARIMKPFGQYKLYTANRIRNIQELSDVTKWYYIETKANFSSDLSSRGGSLQDFIYSKEWAEGPKFLCDPSYVGVQIGRVPENLKKIDAVEKKVVAPALHLTRTFQQFQLLDTTSTYYVDRSFWESEDEEAPGLLYRRKMFRTTAKIIGWIFRFVNNCKAAIAEQPRRSTRLQYPIPKNLLLSHANHYYSPTTKKYLNGFSLPTNFIVKYENLMFTYAQECEFSAELLTLQNNEALDEDARLFKKCQTRRRLHKMTPYWSEDNLIRILTRTPKFTSDTIVLPAKHKVTELFCLSVHLNFNHSGVNDTLYHCNKRCTIMGGRHTISRSQIACSCRAPIPLNQRISPLPDFRYMDPANHVAVGADFCGPFYIFHPDSGNHSVKTFCLVLSCLHTRHITPILLRSCSTEDVILGLREFVALRGSFRIMYCDRAKAFLKTNREMRRILLTVNWNDVKVEFDKWACEFEFGTELASHTCGINEIAVKAIKVGLKRAIGTSCLDFGYLRVVIQECAAACNSRPLGYTTTAASQGGQDLMISPSHLAIGRSVEIFPSTTELPFNKDVNKMYKLRTHQLHQFWKIWRSVYLNNLSISPQWQRKMDFELHEGQYVLLREKSIKKFSYIHAIITKVIRGRDNLIRKLELRTPNYKNVITRHLNQVSLLEHDFLKLQKAHLCSHACLLLSDDVSTIRHDSDHVSDDRRPPRNQVLDNECNGSTYFSSSSVQRFDSLLQSPTP